MTLPKRSQFIVITIFLLALILSSCSFIRIQNIAEGSVTVSVNVPDSGKAYVRNVPSAGIVDVFTSGGGGYTVTMIASKQFIDFLESLRLDIETKLFAERQTLTAEEVTLLVDRLNQIDSFLEQTRVPGASCSGYVPEFETVVVTIASDFETNAFTIECGSGSN
jgi:hypothetical protein